MVAMRRKDRQVSDEEAMAYLKAAEYGVPVSYTHLLPSPIFSTPGL